MGAKKEVIQILTRDQILDMNTDLMRVQPVEIAGWGLVGFKPLNQKERDDYETFLIGNTKKDKDGVTTIDLEGMKSDIISRCICDGEGGLMFSAVELQDFPSRQMDAAWDKVAELNGLENGKVKADQKN